MDSRVLLAFSTVCAAGLMALASLRRARRSDLHALLLALLAALSVWSAGIAAWAQLWDETLRDLAVRVSLVGAFAAAPLWVIFILRVARPRVLERWRLLPALFALPSAIAYLGLITDSGHHLLLREGVSWGESFARFAGPLLKGYAVASTLWVVVAAGVLLGFAGELWRRGEVHRAGLVALGLAALLPLLAGLSRIFIYTSTLHAVAPASFVVSLLLLAAGPLRDRLLHGAALGHRDVFDNLRDGVLVANGSGAIVDANPAAERLLACPRALLRGRQLADLIAELGVPERSSALRAELEDLAASAAPLRLELALPDGRRLEVRAACVGDGEEPAGRYALLRDRSEERRFAEVARRAQKLETVATLAGGVAHEVSNPLAFVRANLGEIERLGAAAERAREKGDSPLAEELSDLRGLAQEALEGIARIERIAAGMRRLSTAGEGFSRVELAPVIDEAVQLARIRFARPLAVELVLEPELPAVRGAPALLVQALLHLLVAVQRGAPPGAIRVRCERVREQVVVRIEASAGEPCARAGEADDPGLALARDIADDHGGELEVLGPGAAPSALALRLPLAEVA